MLETPGPGGDHTTVELKLKAARMALADPDADPALKQRAEEVARLSG
ncbi:MAG: hypothetical protein LBD15_02430 [Holosporales bacterium]|nr:hypothetical protein [Holosporales bacterium]